MKAKRWLQFAACVLLLLNAGCDADYPLPAFINKADFTYAGHENNVVEDLQLWTMPLETDETDESGEIMTGSNFKHKLFYNTGISDSAGKLNHLVRSEPQKRNKHRFVKQPTQEELQESLDRVNKVISRINKVLVSRQ